MNSYKKIGLIVGVLLLFSSSYAAYLKNIPQQITQPDGTIIHCFASGDEFHNWLHDSAGFTITQDAQTGYYVYAALSDDKLVSSEYVVGRVNPESVGLQPNINISAQVWQAKRAAFDQMFAEEKKHKAGGKNKGRINNVVIFIIFKGETGFTTTYNHIDTMFNDASSDSANSMYNFYKLASYGQLSIVSHFYPKPSGDTILSYQDFFERNYYLPYSSSNPNGFSTSNEGWSRKNKLLAAAIDYVQTSIPSNLNFDNDNDGRVDNVCFLVSGSAIAGAGILWPHRSMLDIDPYYSNITINGKIVSDYNLCLEYMYGSNSNTGVITHEMMHTLSAPDLYNYNYSPIDPIGTWDLMASTNYTTPQGLGVYMKYKYGGWIDNIPEIITSGTYTLYPANGSSPQKTAYKIYPDPFFYGNEYLVLEYRNTASNIFEGNLPGSGILIYRIDDRYQGNAQYNGQSIFNEAYLFRPGGTTSRNGDISKAYFAAGIGVNRTSFGLYTNPSAFYTQGGIMDNFSITNITKAGDSIQFTISLASETNSIPNSLPEDGKIFPNPAQSQFTVTNTENTNLYLYNMVGQEILQMYSKEKNTVIHVDFLPQGVYMLKVTKDGISSMYRVVISD